MGRASAGVLFVEGKPFNVQCPTRCYGCPRRCRNSAASSSRSTRASRASGTWTKDLRRVQEFVQPGIRTARPVYCGESGRSAPALMARATVDSSGAKHGPQSLSRTFFDELQRPPWKTANDQRVQLQSGRGPECRHRFAQQQLAADVSAIESYNQSALVTNGKAQSLLREISGQDPGQDNESWQKWWVDQQGYAYQSPQSTSTTDSDLYRASQPSRLIRLSSCPRGFTPLASEPAPWSARWGVRSRSRPCASAT